MMLWAGILMNALFKFRFSLIPLHTNKDSGMKKATGEFLTRLAFQTGTLLATKRLKLEVGAKRD